MIDVQPEEYDYPATSIAENILSLRPLANTRRSLCATPDCVRAAVGSYCTECSEELDKALNEALDARECPHDTVTVYSEGGTKYAQCEDCLEGLPVDYSEMEVDTKEMDFDCE